MISNILIGFISSISVISLILAIVLYRKNKKRYRRKDILSLYRDEILDYNLISFRERPLNELIQKDADYSDIIFCGIKGYDDDGRCNIIINDCDSKNRLTLPNYNEI